MGTVTAVVATMNSGSSLELTLPKLLQLPILEAIVVDGMSSDNSADLYRIVSKEFPTKLRVFHRPPRGLAEARQFGNEIARGKIILHLGPDNIIPVETLKEMVQELEHSDLVSCQTRLSTQDTYLAKAHNFYKHRFQPGRNLTTVGTPYLGSFTLFRDFPFTPEMEHSDDTDLCQRVVEAGLKITRVPAICYETGFESLGAIRERWTRWGHSDFTFFESQKSNWTVNRIAASIVHPIHSELIETFQLKKFGAYLIFFPFLAMVAFFRYFGWLRAWEKKRRKT